MANNYEPFTGRITTDRLLSYHLARTTGREDEPHDVIQNLEVMVSALASGMPRKVVSLSKLVAGKPLVVQGYTLRFEVDLSSVYLAVEEDQEEIGIQFTTFRRKKYGYLSFASCSPEFAVASLRWIESNWDAIIKVMQFHSGADVR